MEPQVQKPIFSFDTVSKPTLTAAELQRASEASENWLSEPGTYDLKVVECEITKVSSDSTWLVAKLKLETTNGKTFDMYPLIPTTAKKNFGFQSTKMEKPK